VAESREAGLLEAGYQQMYRNIAHFPSLTPLRFIAAYLVVIFHVEETRKMFGLANLTRFSLFTHGPLAVTFFFVLSGFLITYLLLREHEQHDRIDVPRFYFRRVLRIWPLYFLMVFVGLVLIPAGVKLGRVPYEAPFESLDVAAYFVLFVPFVVNLTYGNHILTPLWSVGVEEMYYLAWAPTVKWLRKHLLAILVGTVTAKTLLAVWAHYLFQSDLAREVLRMLQFEAMAMGGLAAYFVFHCQRPIHEYRLFSRPAQVLLILPLVVRLFAHRAAAGYSSLYAAVFDHAIFTPLLLMAVFAWFIVNVSLNERTILRLEGRVLHYLGEISYGIYMYHALVISLVFVPFLDEFRAAPALPATLLLHALVAAFTLVFAALSKRFFEDKFLRYKRRFQAVPTGLPAICRPSVSADEAAAALAA
jgi:peptidoglycan/LPS O-acetylase OafA/YrhL